MRAGWAPPIEGQPTRWAEVDPAAIRDNVAAIRRYVGSAPAVMAMVKANGYGHGAVVSAEAAVAGGAAWLGVATAEEALQLHGAELEATVLLVGWSHPSQVPGLLRAGIHVTAYAPAAVAGLAERARALGVRARLHLKLDSGMGRLGARLDTVPELAAAIIAAQDAVDLVAVFSHFPDADGPDLGVTESQHRAFLVAAEPLRRLGSRVLLHCANSAAMLRLPDTHHDIVRPGIALYGYPPDRCHGIVPLRPAMAMKACVTQVKTLRPGETVGYGRTWVAHRETRVATIAAGYADGVQRAQSNRGTALVGGRRCPIVGRVSMDQTSIDVSEVPGVETGDEVVLFGSQGDAWLGADEVAATAGTISYEVLCAVSARVPRLVRERPGSGGGGPLREGPGVRAP